MGGEGGMEGKEGLGKEGKGQRDADDLIICPMLCYSNGTDNNYWSYLELPLYNHFTLADDL